MYIYMYTVYIHTWCRESPAHLTMEGTERSLTLPISRKTWERLGLTGVAGGSGPLPPRDDSGTRG